MQHCTYLTCNVFSDGCNLDGGDVSDPRQVHGGPAGARGHRHPGLVAAPVRGCLSHERLRESQDQRQPPPLPAKHKVLHQEEEVNDHTKESLPKFNAR